LLYPIPALDLALNVKVSPEPVGVAGGPQLPLLLLACSTITMSLGFNVVKVRKHVLAFEHVAEPSRGPLGPTIAPLIIGGTPKASPKDIRNPTMMMATPAIRYPFTFALLCGEKPCLY
jgi:hypothetical protein